MLPKRVIIVGAVLIVVAVIILFSGRIDKTSKPTELERPIAGEPWDYFPTRTGTKWVYEITVGEAEPLSFREISWPLNGRVTSYAVRGYLHPLVSDESRRTFQLVISTRGKASQQGPFQYDGVELAIEKDELGIFKYHKQVFWAMTYSGGFMVSEVGTYSPNTPPAPPHIWGMGKKEGFSVRIIFFSEPGIEVGIGKEPSEEFFFTGVDGPYLHFVREVKVDEKEEGEESTYLDKGFTEETWFVKGKGLVRLEQKVDGKISMVWKLVQFSKGAD